MIALHFFPSPNGLKVAIMLEECGLEYRLEHVNILRGEQFAADFLRISPNNKIPAMVDEDAPGGPLAIFESGAILQYLADKSGRFLPRDEHGRYAVLQWLYWQIGGLGPMAGQAHHFRAFASEVVPYGITRYTNEVNRLYGVLDRQLAQHEYVAGDYSIADMACWPWVVSHERQGELRGVRARRPLVRGSARAPCGAPRLRNRTRAHGGRRCVSVSLRADRADGCRT